MTPSQTRVRMMNQPKVGGPFASGEVGVLGEENAQRLCSAFSESVYECLTSLSNLSSKQDSSGSSFLQLYCAGLACVPQWTHDVLKEEVAGLEARYPEAELLYQYCYLSLLADLGENDRDQGDLSVIISTMSPLSKFYHLFLNRVCASPDVTRGRFFFDQPHAHRRVVFLECFRNALHDVVRQQRRPGPQLLAAPEKGQKNCYNKAVEDNFNKREGSDNKAQSSVFKTALVIAAEDKHISDVTSNKREDPTRRDEDDGNSFSDEKIVHVSSSPCFFADEATFKNLRETVSYPSVQPAALP